MFQNDNHFQYDVQQLRQIWGPRRLHGRRVVAKA